MNQEDINEVMWNSLPQWRKDQLNAEREGTKASCRYCRSQRLGEHPNTKGELTEPPKL